MTEISLAESRRDFIRHSVGLLAFAIGGSVQLLTPADARQKNVPYRAFDGAQVKTLEALGEILLPGSAAAGLAHFIDVQLSGPALDGMLMIKYLGLNPPFTDFYKSGLAGVESAARAQYSKALGDLAAKDAHALVAGMAKGEIAGWSGPPAPLFFFVLRNDAVDVSYGTVAGFESLNVPYMPHIPPATRWGE